MECGGKRQQKGKQRNCVEATAVFQANNGVCSDRDSSGEGRSDHQQLAFKGRTEKPNMEEKPKTDVIY